MPTAARNPDSSFSLPVVKTCEGLHATSIEWADFSFNPIRAINTANGKIGWACTKVSEACANCYAESVNKVYGTGLPYTADAMKKVRIVLDEQRMAAALHWKPKRGWKPKAPDGRPKVFVADMTDLFGDWVPFKTIDILFALFAVRHDIDWLLLTKRPERMAEYLERLARYPGVADPVFEAIKAMGERPPGRFEWPLPNVWCGTTVENQAAADKRIRELPRCPAAVRFLSVEPLLGPIDLGTWFFSMMTDAGACAIDWVIVGCESNGPKVGRVDRYWTNAEMIRAQCQAAGVAFFHKQWPAESKVESDPEKCPSWLAVREWPKGGSR